MIFEELKFLFQKIFGAKYKITGKCLKCGKCCKEITFLIGNKYISTEEQFELMKKYDKSYKNFIISGYDKDKNALLFRCLALSDDNKCKAYWYRSIACRLYPNPSKKFLLGGGKLLDGCGFKISTTKSFEDFLK